VGCGDFNVDRDSSLFGDFVAGTGLADALAITHRRLSVEPGVTVLGKLPERTSGRGGKGADGRARTPQVPQLSRCPRSGTHPAEAGGGLWLCSTLVPSGLRAVVVPSGCRATVQPCWWMATW
jgi:hypothetical protein